MTSEARFIADLVLYLVFGGAFFGVCLFAWLKGRTPERYGAALYFLSVSATLAFQLLTGQATPVVPELFFDAIVASGFLYLAVRYNSPWLGFAMIVKGLQLALHAIHLTDISDPVAGGLNLYAASLELISFVILGAIFCGTLASLRERRSTRLNAPTAGVESAAG